MRFCQEGDGHYVGRMFWAFRDIRVLNTCPVFMKLLRGGADKSLARPGRKQATAPKLGIYSVYFPRSSIHFLARCSNFWKPVKKIRKVVRPAKSPQQPDMLPFSLCNKKTLAIRHMNRTLFPTTLSAPSYDIGKQVGLRTYQHPLVMCDSDHFPFGRFLVQISPETCCSFIWSNRFLQANAVATNTISLFDCAYRELQLRPS